MYDYVPGKLDWMARGLPIEGRRAGEPTAASVARRDAPICTLEEQIGDVRTRVEASGYDVCIVTNDKGIVAGILRAGQFDAPADAQAEEAMRPGPSTFRPHVPAAEMAEYMTRHDLANVPVTSAQGRLIGVLLRQDAVHAAQAQHGDRRLGPGSK